MPLNIFHLYNGSPKQNQLRIDYDKIKAGSGLKNRAIKLTLRAGSVDYAELDR
jgi:hypothetical protein